MFYTNCLFFTAFILSLSSLSNLDRIKTKIYKNLENKYYCFRRLDDKNQIGCNTKESGNVGVVYLVNEQKDLDHVLKIGNHYPYVPVITPKYFNFQILSQFKSGSERISGVLVLNESVSQLKSYSPDKSCPNDKLDLYATNVSYSHCRKQKWNLVDNRNNDRINENLMFNDWPFPIFLIRDETNITELENCFKRFFNSWPLCTVQLTTSSYGAKDSKTCIRRSFLSNNPINILRKVHFCQPLKASNSFSPLLTTHKNLTIKDRSVIVLASRLDSFSMFKSITPGADSVITALVTFLSIVQTLSQQSIKDIIKSKAPEKNVLFALFDGESLDYIGSSRTIFDMNAGVFPVDPQKKNILNISEIRTKHFSHFIELNQLAFRGTPQQKQTLYMHKNIHKNPDLNKLQELIKNNSKNSQLIDFESTTDGTPLPPSSLQSFLKNDDSLLGLVITNHKNEYTNKFYNSIYDSLEQLNEKHNTNITELTKYLTNIATIISQSIFDLLTSPSDLTVTNDRNETNLTVNEETVKSLLTCYLINTNCSLFNTVSEPKDNPNVTFETYSGSVNHSIFSYYTYNLLFYFNGEEVTNQTEEECLDDDKQENRFYYVWIPGPYSKGMCHRSHSVLRSDTSPAFVDYRETGILVNTSLYSTWTQSLIRTASVRMFVSPSPFQQWLTLILGITVLVISIIIIVFFQTFAKYIFDVKGRLEESSESKTVTSQTLK